MTAPTPIRPSLFTIARTTIFLGQLCLAVSAQAEVSKCGEIFTDKECVNGVPLASPPSSAAAAEPPSPSSTDSKVASLTDLSSADSSLADSSLADSNPDSGATLSPAMISSAMMSSATESAVSSAGSSAVSSVIAPAQPGQIKPLVMERPDPWMDWRREEVADTRWVFKGKLKGNGKTRISLVISKASYTGNIARDYVEASRIFDLPSWGGEIEFNFPVDVPPPMRTWNWRWFLKAEYVGKWLGYRDFRGCCGAKDVEARCRKDGGVECSPSKVSESCRCF